MLKKQNSLSGYNPEPFWISKGLSKYLEKDWYGWYKKPGIKIPWIYRKEYEKCKKEREWFIEKKFSFKNSNPSDTIEKEKLLRMG